VGLMRADVEKVALLARLELSATELDQMAADLARIVAYVGQLDELATDAVEPMAHAMDLRNVFAEDELEPSLERDQALANAPKRDAECYRVPAVLEE